MRRPGRRRQRGAVAVELALCIPALCIIIFGGVVLARAIHARARLVDAVGVAARGGAVQAALTGSVNDTAIQQTITSRMNGVGGCAPPFNVQITRPTVGGIARLDVTASCNVTGVGVPFLGALPITQVSATASMPLDIQN